MHKPTKRKFECRFCRQCYGSNENLQAHIRAVHDVGGLDAFGEDCSKEADDGHDE